MISMVLTPILNLEGCRTQLLFLFSVSTHSTRVVIYSLGLKYTFYEGDSYVYIFCPAISPNSRIIQPTAYSTHPPKNLTGISSITYPKLSFHLFLQTYSVQPSSRSMAIPTIKVQRPKTLESSLASTLHSQSISEVSLYYCCSVIKIQPENTQAIENKMID